MILFLAVLMVLAAALVVYSTRMPGRSHRGALPPLTEEEAALERRLAAHVAHLARTIGERHFARPEGLEEAVRYLQAAFAGLGYETRVHEFEAWGATFHNVEVELPGGERADEIVVVGAHYDTVRGTPGADDNASGVAALIEVARLLRGSAPARTVRFVALANEEPPFFRGPDMGSYRYARRCRERGEEVAAMFALESLGYYDDVPGSQRYPPPLGLLYPDRGDFIAFVGNLRSARLVRQAIGAFRQGTPFPSEGIAAPPLVPGVGFSDQRSFWVHGYPALMITDVPLYRNPHYHRATDTPEQVDTARLARVTGGIARVVAHVAGG
jgi:hypothetical protein